MDPYLIHAEDMLGDTLHHRLPRARRIAGIYAAIYLEDPLLHQWGGLASFVAHHIAMAMDSTGGAVLDFMGVGSLAIYRRFVPAFLRRRDGLAVTGPLAPGFNLLTQADQHAASDMPLAQAEASHALRLITEFEQTVVIQPAYDQLGFIAAHLIAPAMRMRLGMDSGARVITFDGHDPRRAEQRLTWLHHDVLPAWQQAFSHDTERVRADVDRVRRWSGVRLSDLPRPGAISGSSPPIA